MKEILHEYGKIKERSHESSAAVELAKIIQDFITEHFYTCTDKILLGLGAMYSGGEDITANIDKAGGPGTAVFADKAIQAYCKKEVM